MHADTRRKERFQSFESGLVLLRHALARGPEALNSLEREGAIRRFEYCLDLAWKAAKEFLEHSGLRIAPVTPREVIRQGVAAGILADGQVWIDMLDHRIFTPTTRRRRLVKSPAPWPRAISRRWSSCANSSRRRRQKPLKPVSDSRSSTRCQRSTKCGTCASEIAFSC